MLLSSNTYTSYLTNLWELKMEIKLLLSRQLPKSLLFQFPIGKMYLNSLI